MMDLSVESEKIIKRPTAKEMLALIKRLPDAENHIYFLDGEYRVTNEFLVGGFCGSGFGGISYEEAAEKLIDHLYRHIGHDSIVGKVVTESGFPNLDKVYEYCKSESEGE